MENKIMNQFPTASNGDAKTMAENAKSAIDSAAAPLAEKAQQLHDKGFAAIDKMADKYEDVQESAVQTKRQVLAATDAFVQENPWRSTVIAAVVGLLAGVIIVRR
jgi:ElaB/YqjD/DUF883 family membrane-anchored ribosome-binding protein